MTLFDLDDKAASQWAKELRCGAHASHVVDLIHRYSELTLKPPQHPGSDSAHYGSCTDPIWADGSYGILGRRL